MTTFNRVTVRRCPILHIESKLFWASVSIASTLLFSSQLALAQFTQQGLKLVGAGAVGSAAQGNSIARPHCAANRCVRPHAMRRSDQQCGPRSDL
jgi:hypothetical protein